MRAVTLDRPRRTRGRALGHACQRAVPAAALWLATAAGCSDSTTPITAADVVGAYALASVDGRALPIPSGGTSVLTSEVTTYHADGTWTNETHFDSPPLVQSFSGTWYVDGSVLRESYRTTGGTQGSGSYQISDRGQTLTFVGAQGTFVYKKQ